MRLARIDPPWDPWQSGVWTPVSPLPTPVAFQDILLHTKTHTRYILRSLPGILQSSIHVINDKNTAPWSFAFQTRLVTVIREFSVIWPNQIAGTFMLYRNGTKGGQNENRICVYLCHMSWKFHLQNVIFYTFCSKINLCVILFFLKKNAEGFSRLKWFKGNIFFSVQVARVFFPPYVT